MVRLVDGLLTEVLVHHRAPSEFQGKGATRILIVEFEVSVNYSDAHLPVFHTNNHGMAHKVEFLVDFLAEVSRAGWHNPVRYRDARPGPC